jgi:hypothetical protein
MLLPGLLNCRPNMINWKLHIAIFSPSSTQTKAGGPGRQAHRRNSLSWCLSSPIQRRRRRRHQVLFACCGFVLTRADRRRTDSNQPDLSVIGLHHEPAAGSQDPHAPVSGSVFFRIPESLTLESATERIGMSRLGGCTSTRPYTGRASPEISSRW